MMRDLAAITADAATSLRPLLQEAFEAGRHVGRAEGRREASDEMLAKVAGILQEAFGPGATELQTTEVDIKSGSVVAADTERAPSGTVKPVVLQTLLDNPDGLSVAAITVMTGFKKNSVRGTLWTIKNEGGAERRGERWFAITKGKAAGEKSVRDTPAALFDNPEHDREAGRGGGT